VCIESTNTRVALGRLPAGADVQLTVTFDIPLLEMLTLDEDTLNTPFESPINTLNSVASVGDRFEIVIVDSLGLSPFSASVGNCRVGPATLNNKAAEHLNENRTVGCCGSLVINVRVSVCSIEAGAPGGGEHEIEIDVEPSRSVAGTPASIENHESGARGAPCVTLSRPAPRFDTSITDVDVWKTLPNSTAWLEAAGVDENTGSAVHDTCKLAVGRFGSLLDSTRVSTNGSPDRDPFGGEHTTLTATEPLLVKFVIGSDALPIENHDEPPNDPTCSTTRAAAPWFEIEIRIDELDVTFVTTAIDLGAGDMTNTGAALHDIE